MVNLLILLALAASCKADGGIAYRGPPPVKEVFHLNDDITYYLYSEKVSWDEARAVCTADKGQLAVPDDSVKAKFLAQSIRDAWAAFEETWIGGRLVQNVWQWAKAVPKKLPETSRQAINMTFLYPPWVDGATPNRKGRECMAIDRNGHSDPYFIDLECKLKRPFICETVLKDASVSPRIQKKISIYDYEFILYHGRVTWVGAVSFCRSQGYVLASVSNTSYADKLAKAMLKTRPEFKDVWIGGSFRNDKWTWVENSEEIPSESLPSGDKGVMYPPWAHVPPQSSPDYCILFDRQLIEAPTFNDIKCNRLRDFVCAKSLQEDHEEIVKEVTTTVRRKKYVVHQTPATFDEGRAICENKMSDNGPGGKLLYIDGGETQDAYDELSVLMQIMSDNKDELIHVWLAATYDETIHAFKWLYDVPNFQVNNSENTRVLATETNERTGYPPWCNDDELTKEMPCLNLDRQNYNTPLFYGLECNATQSVICVVEAKPKGVERFHVKERAYQTCDSHKAHVIASWTRAQRYCEEETGSLLTDVSDEEMKEIVSKLPDGDYFIGGKYSGAGHTPTWVPSQLPIKLSAKQIQPYEAGKNCLLMTVTGKSMTSIHGVSCNEKGQHDFVCSDKCDNQVDEVKDHTWHCDWHEGKAVTEAVLGKACKKRCPINQVLVGSKKLTCQANGWVGSRLAKAARCLDSTEAAAQVTNLIINSTTDNGVLFIYDGSREVKSEQLQVMQYIIASTITKLHDGQRPRQRRYIGHHHSNRRAKSRSRRDTEVNDAMEIPLINLNGAKVDEVLVLDGSTQCEMIGNLAKKKLDVGKGRRDYAHAFYQAKAKLATYDWPYSVVVISGGPNQGEDYRERLRELKGFAKSIVTLGIGHKSNYEELADIASVNSDRVLQHASIADYQVFKKLGDSIADPSKCTAELTPLKAQAKKAVEQLSHNVELQPKPPVNVELESTTISKPPPTDEQEVSSQDPGVVDGSTAEGGETSNEGGKGLSNNLVPISEGEDSPRNHQVSRK